TFSGSKQFSLSQSPPVTASVSYAFAPSLTLAITIHTSWHLPTGISLYYALDATSAVQFSLTAGGEWSAQESVVLGRDVLGGFDIGPVFVVPELVTSVTLSASAQATATLSGTITEHAHDGFTLGADVGGKFINQGDTNNGISPPQVSASPSITVKAEATAMLNLQFDLTLDGIIGPDADIGVGVEVSVDPAANPWWQVDGIGQFSIGMNFNSLNIALLSDVLHLLHLPVNPTWTLGSITLPLLSAGGPFGGQAGGAGVPGSGAGTSGGTGTPGNSGGTYPQPPPSGGGGGTPPPSGGGGGTPPPTSNGPQSISIGWGSNPAPSGDWMDITFTNFPVGSVSWYCVEEGHQYGPYTTTLSSSTETLTANTCYDTEAGGSDYVTSDGATSNTIATDASPPPTARATYPEATGDGPVHTWSSPDGPSGTEGPTLSANTVYQVDCVTTGTAEGPGGDPYWYLLDGTDDYGSADAFCDEGATTCPGGFAGTPLVDSRVPQC
ncbi:MAG TPA: hypothetical protein VME46_23270, partial [Acidimicrobiales bacterium]|nr:hypothetical protein [Acidimicrobiales bacterium]